MKPKHLFYILLLFIPLLCLTACSDDEDKINSPIVGKWICIGENVSEYDSSPNFVTLSYSVDGHTETYRARPPKEQSIIEYTSRGMQLVSHNGEIINSTKYDINKNNRLNFYGQENSAKNNSPSSTYYISFNTRQDTMIQTYSGPEHVWIIPRNIYKRIK
uniref:Lipocalin-like domain-containing protein n=1 Tax=Prevotella sp. GTC17262 TaxID=3236797 RepID=A0AB33JH25_9BACT